MYLRFEAMILTAMVVMYATMFVGSSEWSHVRWSESRFLHGVDDGSGGAVLGRTQATVQDTGLMRSMIPHHSLAITRSERAELADVRVCELAVEISESQRREIHEMNWLIDDVERNGVAGTPEAAATRGSRLPGTGGTPVCQALSPAGP
jgi:uncharacterized protein (DUF305 family)